MERFYPIGTPGEPWTDAEKAAWYEGREIQRSYEHEVLDKLADLRETFEVVKYGSLPTDPERYPLFAVKMLAEDENLPWVLITGGVHGYETSGVQGALAFLRTLAEEYRGKVNLIVAPCVSPWGYEVINRWNPKTVDPNRSFKKETDSEEAEALMKFIAGFDVKWLMHMDLHETTDSDEEEFRPALSARDGEAYEPGLIPDGFYTVGDTDNPQPEFQRAIISSVEKVTHIAPPDENNQIIGSDVTQNGVINYPCAPLGLCAGMTGARFTTTTEVYPDSPKATPEICNQAQVAAVRGGLEYALANA